MSWTLAGQMRVNEDVKSKLNSHPSLQPIDDQLFKFLQSLRRPVEASTNPRRQIKRDRRPMTADAADVARYHSRRFVR